MKLRRPPAGDFTRKLLRKFQRNAIERYGLGVVKGKKITRAAVSDDDRRRLRNARKQERQAAR